MAKILAKFLLISLLSMSACKSSGRTESPSIFSSDETAEAAKVVASANPRIDGSIVHVAMQGIGAVIDIVDRRERSAHRMLGVVLLNIEDMRARCGSDDAVVAVDRHEA